MKFFELNARTRRELKCPGKQSLSPKRCDSFQIFSQLGNRTTPSVTTLKAWRSATPISLESGTLLPSKLMNTDYQLNRYGTKFVWKRDLKIVPFPAPLRCPTAPSTAKFM